MTKVTIFKKEHLELIYKWDFAIEFRAHGMKNFYHMGPVSNATRKCLQRSNDIKMTSWLFDVKSIRMQRIATIPIKIHENLTIYRLISISTFITNKHESKYANWSCNGRDWQDIFGVILRFASFISRTVVILDICHEGCILRVMVVYLKISISFTKLLTSWQVIKR